MTRNSAIAALHFRLLAAELAKLLSEPSHADTTLVCGDGSLRMNRLYAAIVLHEAVGIDSSAMRDIAAVASTITGNLTILLPSMAVARVKKLLNECLIAPFQLSEQGGNTKKNVTRPSVICSTTVGKASAAVARIYQCSLCQFSARSQSNLNQHLNSRHGKIRYKCVLCNTFTTTTSNNLKRHLRTVHEGLKLSCSSCTYSASSRAKLKHHWLTHHEGLRFLCATCPFSSTTAASLKRHMRIKHEGEGSRVACKICNTTFASQQHLKVHVEVVHLGVRHPCTLCQYVATTKSHLRAHVKRAHL